jgi:hypothetical protein
MRADLRAANRRGGNFAVSSAAARGPAMRVPARDIAVGDVLRVNDWELHVVAVERDLATAVLTAEFGFLLHFTRDDVVDVLKPVLAG